MVSELTPNHLGGVSVRFRTNFMPLEQFWSDLKQIEKIEFSKHFCLDFKHIACINPYQKPNIFDISNLFFKNEAFNQKSEKVKLRGYT